MVIVTGKDNNVVFDGRVFGIDRSDPEECDLPDPEALGTLLTDEETVNDCLRRYVNRRRTYHL